MQRGYQRLRMARLLALILAFSLAGLSAAAASGGGELSAPTTKRRPTALESYVMVDPVTVTIVYKRAARGFLVVEFGLDVADEALRGRVESDLPRLRDAYVRTMSTYAGAVVKPYEQADIDSISTRLQRVTDFILGGAGAKVLLSQVVVRAGR